MNRDRIKLEVFVDLDPTPGEFYSKESARNQVSNILRAAIPHYNPTVSTTNYLATYQQGTDVEDWSPLGEDATNHCMGPFVTHEDGRMCAFHNRLEKWAFCMYDTNARWDKQCLRDHTDI